jgi:molybdopterin-guanine dinucleotide biosynthesis protein A
MGQDKATLLLRGSPMVRRMVSLLELANFAPVLAGSRPDLAGYATVLEDLHPGCGPLSGIEAGLHFQARQPGSSPDDPVLFVPVDTPLVPVGLLTMLWDRSARTGALATIPLAGALPQPLCAVYRTTLLPGITAALEAGHYKVMRVIQSLTTPRSLDLFHVEALPNPLPATIPTHLWFANLNAPDDLQLIERLIEQPALAPSRIH